MNDNPGIKGVILDWAGTAVDCGSRGPAEVFKRAFEAFGIFPSIEEIREPMGKEKREHVRLMLAMPRIEKSWQEANGKMPDETDISRKCALKK